MKVVLDKGAFEPLRGHEDDAGLDLRTPEKVTIHPGGSVTINTRVHCEIPKGYFGKLESKSGLNVKHGVVCLGGIIDSGFTGSIVVKLYNFGPGDHTFYPGDKVVQMIIQPCNIPVIEYVDSLTKTERGASGFGSTGQ